ncbi:MAG: DUF58 domain-containing protein [Nanoarchaeota archaeon]|nr:DUF58 domain-containing protein [Nanoarchaeota archaeon]
MTLRAKIEEKVFPKEKQEIPVNVFDFDTLIEKTIKNSKKLKEYFRMNLIYYQLISGKGLEFDKIKEYMPGYDPRRIDWKIYARTNKLFVRHFKEERNFDIIIILDVSNSMLLGTNEYTKNEFASVIAGTLAFAAVEAGDNVGGGLFSSKHELLLDPDQDYYNLLNIMTNKKMYGGKKNWKKLAERLLGIYNSDAILFIISDFIDTNVQEFIPELAAGFAKVYGIMVRDPIDDKLPEGVGRIYLRDPDSGEVVLTDLEEVREEYELLNKRKIEQMKDAFHSYEQLFFKLKTGDDFSTGFIRALGEEQVIIS